MTCWKISHLDPFSSMIFPLKPPSIVDFPICFIVFSYLFYGFPWFSYHFPMIFHQKLGFPEGTIGYPKKRQVSSLNCSAVAHDVVEAAAAREAAAPEANCGQNVTKHYY